jgi:transglutaminase-like putative cysteine protease
VTETEIRFAEEPDWTKEMQEVTVIATDAGGNSVEKRFTLKLKPDTEAPVLYGVKNRFCYVGEPVAYLAEVSAVDNCDGEVKVEVDASNVNESRRGNYRVTYRATDRAGNTVRKTVTFKFIRAKVDDDEAQAVAEKTIKKIFTDDMTLAEQIEAIFDYVHTHIRYTPKSNKQDWRSEAVRGLTTGRGDCFTSCSAARLLLEQTDAQIMSVQRAGANTHHYWLLVNIGTGWYHYDPSCVGASRRRCFMWTTEQTRKVSKTYWGFNASLYPPVATEPYNGGK